MKTKLKVFDLLQKVRREGPVVHHLTIWVTIYDCAQIVKTLGASPVMAHAPEAATAVQISGIRVHRCLSAVELRFLR